MIAIMILHHFYLILVFGILCNFTNGNAKSIGCPENQNRSDCWQECSCITLKQGDPCSTVCIDNDPNILQCVCKEGYFRDSDANYSCTPKSICRPGLIENNEVTAAAECGLHEEFNECGGCSERSCNHRVKRCITVCVPGCYCKDGYLRFGSACVNEEDRPA